MLKSILEDEGGRPERSQSPTQSRGSSRSQSATRATVGRARVDCGDALLGLAGLPEHMKTLVRSRLAEKLKLLQLEDEAVGLRDSVRRLTSDSAQAQTQLSASVASRASDCAAADKLLSASKAGRAADSAAAAMQLSQSQAASATLLNASVAGRAADCASASIALAAAAVQLSDASAALRTSVAGRLSDGALFKAESDASAMKLSISQAGRLAESAAAAMLLNASVAGRATDSAEAAAAVTAASAAAAASQISVKLILQADSMARSGRPSSSSSSSSSSSLAAWEGAGASSPLLKWLGEGGPFSPATPLLPFNQGMSAQECPSPSVNVSDAVSTPSSPDWPDWESAASLALRLATLQEVLDKEVAAHSADAVAAAFEIRRLRAALARTTAPYEESDAPRGGEEDETVPYRRGRSTTR